MHEIKNLWFQCLCNSKKRKTNETELKPLNHLLQKLKQQSSHYFIPFESEVIKRQILTLNSSPHIIL